MNNPESTLARVTSIIVRTLDIEEQAREINASTPLFGAMPELDSFAVVELAAALEEEFDITIDDEQFSADVFETVGSLADFVTECQE
ncbi:MAG TPA: phosphopantetheine-binding protein [Nakamurella multipartita]|mgnify:CR=1 FL=1|nr:phosphopantetheine-binding protein [Nakamurella multipartita]